MRRPGSRLRAVAVSRSLELARFLFLFTILLAFASVLWAISLIGRHIQ